MRPSPTADSLTVAAIALDDATTLEGIDGCEMVDLLLPDMNGLLRGKRITRDALDKVYNDGVCLPMSLIATDITGNTVEETGLGYDIGDEDRICRPVPGSLRNVPWSPRPMAQVLLSMEDAQGGTFEANPREVLQRVLARYTERGLTPVVAVELEFYLFDQRPDSEGRPEATINPVTGLRNRSTQVYYMEDLNDYRNFTDAVAAACRAQRIPADTAVAEYAPGQFEVNLKHRDDALQACDDAVYLKRAIKAVAQQQGAMASFMAKPRMDQAGSGMHIHVSLLDRDGRNIFASPVDAPADALKHAIGGLQHNAKDCLLLFAPHAGATTIAPWRCGYRIATRPTRVSSIALPALTPISIWSPPPCWPACWKAWNSSAIRARRSLATPTNRPKTAPRSGARQSATSSPATLFAANSARAFSTSTGSRSSRKCTASTHR